MEKTITTFSEIDKIVKRIIRLFVIFHRKKFESTYDEEVTNRTYLVSELHANKVLNETVKNGKRTI